MAAPGNLDVHTERAGSALVVSPRGEIDLSTVDSLRDAIESGRSPGEALVIDLRGVAFMDTTGLRLLLALTEGAKTEGFELRIVRGPRAVQRVFEVSGLEPRLPFVDDPADELPSGG